jgi:hypothetical protein
VDRHGAGPPHGPDPRRPTLSGPRLRSPGAFTWVGVSPIGRTAPDPAAGREGGA